MTFPCISPKKLPKNKAKHWLYLCVMLPSINPNTTGGEAIEGNPELIGNQNMITQRDNNTCTKKHKKLYILSMTYYMVQRVFILTIAVMIRTKPYSFCKMVVFRLYYLSCCSE